MKTNLIHLTDGTTMSVNVNFATLYYMQKTGLTKKLNKLGSRKPNESESMEISRWIIYAVLRSNGKTVSDEEAMCLVPADTDEIESLLNEFYDRLKELKKKQDGKRKMKRQQEKSTGRHT